MRPVHRLRERDRLPHAAANRVADRFHVVQLLAKAVDRMRAAGDARRRRRSWQFPVGQGPFSF
ncbi:transposase [Eggerthella timonensis]|uniref:transposase n=1 Tax=Eggerthella timonensis TaxID=1871008 RepID=UPI0011AFCF30